MLLALDHDLGSAIAIAAGALCGMVIFSAVPIAGLFVLQRALWRCSRGSRTMAPVLVWLNLIPLFNFIWSFVTVVHVYWSLRNEYRALGWHNQIGTYRLWVGLGACALLWLWVTLLPMHWFGLVEVPSSVGGALGWGWLLCLLVYLALVAGLSERLRASLEPINAEAPDN